MNHREELEVLTELAQVGNMRRVADVLGLSQSTVSDVVTRLEAAYGAVLFERGRRGSRPTVYGRLVVDAAAQALRLMQEAQREIDLIKGSASGRLAIGAEPGLIEPFLTPAIAHSLQHLPGLRFRLQALDSSTLVHELREKRIDFFLGIRPDVPVGGLSLREIGQVDVVPFVRSGHVLASAGQVTLARIMSCSIVQGPGPRWLVRRIAEAVLVETGTGDSVQRDATLVVNEFGVVRAVVRQTDAVGFAVAPMLSPASEQRDFKALQLPPAQAALLRLPVFLATLDDRALPPSALAVIAAVEAVVAGQAP
jgi:DNA-binding transcriptional LysR family regulator